MSETVPLHSLDEEQALLGPQDAHARAIRNRFEVTFVVRSGRVHIEGDEEKVGDARAVVCALLDHIRTHDGLDEEVVERLLAEGPAQAAAGDLHGEDPDKGGLLLPPGVTVRSKGQERYVRNVQRNTITICIGPAGTGKTYLAAAVAVAALRRGHFKKVILVRPAVEAGEHLGFLPGDLEAKINPFLRPLSDALSAHLEPGRLKHYIDSDVIEIAPLAYMRGRNLDEAFIILDEAQNTTRSQMRMFLTRMGTHSKIVVAGDETQVDLPAEGLSGLRHAEGLLRNIPGVSTERLGNRDIVRHPLVQKIVNAYEQEERERADRLGRGRR
jgi:phosphate starvation-inducible PhoH-like protein